MKSMDAISKQSSPPVIVIGGPTASGKSAAALSLAHRIAATIINADSMQVYRELSVLTARPSAADMAAAPHRLFGVMSVAERCTAGRWREMALGEIADAHSAGRLPILVGGTGLYLRALMAGLAAIPPIGPTVRAETQSRHRALGPAAFHAELAVHDPETAARLSPGDTQRVIRAYEVWHATGRPLSAYQHETPPAPSFTFISLVLLPPHDVLRGAIDLRCRAMLTRGALDEVRSLIALHLDPSLPAMKALGVREMARHLCGEIDRASALALFQQATRQFAKRQRTWFRHQMPEPQFWFAQFSESISDEMFSFIRKKVDGFGLSL